MISNNITYLNDYLEVVSFPKVYSKGGFKPYQCSRDIERGRIHNPDAEVLVIKELIALRDKINDVLSQLSPKKESEGVELDREIGNQIARLKLYKKQRKYYPRIRAKKFKPQI